MLALGGDAGQCLAGAAPGDQDGHGEREERHERDGHRPDRQVGTRGEQPEGGAGADGLPGRSVDDRLDEPGQEHRDEDDEQRRGSGEQPDGGRPQPGDPRSTLVPGDVIGVLPGLGGAGEDGAEAVDDRHRHQCA